MTSRADSIQTPVTPPDSPAATRVDGPSAGSVISSAKHGWRRRRVGERVEAGDLIEIGWDPKRLVEEKEIGQRVLGMADGFDDRVWAPRKRAKKKTSPNTQAQTRHE